MTGAMILRFTTSHMSYNLNPIRRLPLSLSVAMSQFFENHPTLLLAAEAGVALLLLIFIVVWTMGTAKKNPRPTRAPEDHPSRAGQSRSDADTTPDA